MDFHSSLLKFLMDHLGLNEHHSAVVEQISVVEMLHLSLVLQQCAEKLLALNPFYPLILCEMLHKFICTISSRGVTCICSQEAETNLPTLKRLNCLCEFTWF